MILATPTSAHRSDTCWELLVLAGTIMVALVSAQDYAGGANDGSRLATVEALVDYHTLAIDRSIFVTVPPLQAGRPAPYPLDKAGWWRLGTCDKVLVRGHFYSDKPATQSLLMAGMYQAFQWCTALKACDRPDDFCYWMTVGSSGLAYVLAVWCVYRLGRPLRLPLSWRLALAASFALATVALPYVRHVNNHIVLLAVAAALFLRLAWLVEGTAARRSPWQFLALGSLAGLGYAIDVAAGLGLLLGTAAVVLCSCRAFRMAALFALAALPWLALHHAVNYAIGGTWGPVGAVPEYFKWPGSPFTEQNLTGVWTNHTPGTFLVYALDLLVGRKRGFLGHNLPLFLALAAGGVLAWRRGPERPVVLLAGCWCGSIWLVYALGSTNYAGVCCSVRWFVPMLAAGYYVLALWLRQRPEFFGDFLLLSGWGAVAGCLMWWEGPWLKHEVALFWLLEPLALCHWLLYRVWVRRRRTGGAPANAQGPGDLARAA